MFERFSERARLVIVHGQEEAQRLRHNYIGTEHLLLGLLREQEGLAARVLGSLGVGLEAVRRDVARIVGTGDELAAGQVPFTPRAKKVLELSLREAQALSHPYIRTEHILLGLVTEGEGVANRIMDDLGASGERIRAEIKRQLERRAGGWPGEAPAELPEREADVRIESLYVGESRWADALGAAPAVLAGAAAFAAGLLVGWAIWA